ncbi:MAG: CDP-alcohol phosphatidyltransferase family protein [Calditrichaeota bacterium]|nr:CDP-alcohol phosphatidyltransferase family protein [Calditrichota bacterium]
MMKEPLDVKELTKSRPAFYFDRSKVLAQMRLLPNIISITRIIMIIPICFLYANPSKTAYWATIALLVVSYLSDYADGVAARRLGQISSLGLILDPLADKLWTFFTVILLVRFRDLPLWIALVLIVRDFFILLLNTRLFRNVGTIFPSDVLGKIYMILLGLMVIGYTLKIRESYYINMILLPLALLTLLNYYRRIHAALRVTLGKSVLRD